MKKILSKTILTILLFSGVVSFIWVFYVDPILDSGVDAKGADGLIYVMILTVIYAIIGLILHYIFKAIEWAIDQLAS